MSSAVALYIYGLQMHEGEGVKLYWTLTGKDNDYSLLINETCFS